MLTPKPEPGANENGDLPPPDIEISPEDSMRAIMDKPDYTSDDIGAIAAHQRDRRRKQAQAEAIRKQKAEIKAAKAAKSKKD
jgi:hypothetical protein